MTISDQTGRAWVTAFNDIAEPLLGGNTADHLHELKANGEVRHTACCAVHQSYLSRDASAWHM